MFVLSAACYSGVVVFFLCVFAPFYFVMSTMVFVLFYVFAAGYDI